ncbi:MAG: flagellar basal body rod protein FlgC [Acetobacter sp.]|nr:flagellar basal body rod protein FlgC [Acetobacter sp.]MBR2124286.1 flagellar basal body rod protein FlgC [Acetobacter sp.]
MDFADTLGISGDGMRVEAARLRIVAENLANRDTTGQTPGSDPYRRKTITFKETLNRETGVVGVKVAKIGEDMSPFDKKYDPTSPVADKQGYVKIPNVHSVIEVMDTHEAQHSFAANLNTFQVTRSMLVRTINIMQ